SALVCALAIGLSAVPVGAAFAGSNYDGTWSLVFVTQRGECDPSYSFDVNITHGIVSHPNLVRFTGRVGANGLVHASVAVQDKYAAGSGKLTKTAGQGTWKGRSGTARCSGYWTAQKSGRASSLANQWDRIHDRRNNRYRVDRRRLRSQ